MRILSLVTLISPHGEYGGPVRVALNQAEALQKRGHDVTVAGSQRGYGSDVPTVIGTVPVSLFPARTVVPGIGFAGLAAPALQRWLARAARQADIVHIHAARDFVTLPAADWLRRHRIPYVLQTHGMIDPSKNPLAIPLDAALTRRALRAARHVFYLTEEEKRGLTTVAGASLRLRELPNGVPQPPAFSAEHPRTEVLFLARLAPRKRPAHFVDMARLVAASFPDASFRLVGPDEGEGPNVAQRIAALAGSVDIAWEGALPPETTTERMSRAAIYVLPSVDEPYPMSVLEAMALGLPVVITDTCGLAPLVRSSGCGIVVDDSTASLVAAVVRLLGGPELAASMGRAGARIARERLSMSSIAAALEQAYRE